MKLFKYVLLISAVLGMQHVALANDISKDSENIAMLNAINTQEVKEADLALKMNVNSAIKDFATMMKTDHNQSLSDTKNLSDSIHIAPTETDEVKKLKAKGEEEYKKLSSLTGRAFESAYIDSMINGHKDALSFLDKAINDTQNNSLKDYFRKVREKVSMHLQHAEKLKG